MIKIENNCAIEQANQEKKIRYYQNLFYYHQRIKRNVNI